MAIAENKGEEVIQQKMDAEFRVKTLGQPIREDFVEGYQAINL